MFKFLSNLFGKKKEPRLVLPVHTQAVPAPMAPPAHATPEGTAYNRKASAAEAAKEKPASMAVPEGRLDPQSAVQNGSNKKKNKNRGGPPAPAAPVVSEPARVATSPVHTPVFAAPVVDAPALEPEVEAIPAMEYVAPSIEPAVVAEAVTAAPAVEPAPAPKPVDAREEWARKASAKLDINANPEELCGILPSMTKDDISTLLANLYRRHNRAASSLDAALREEAEAMLDIIANMREKYLDR